MIEWIGRVIMKLIKLMNLNGKLPVTGRRAISRKRLSSSDINVVVMPLPARSDSSLSLIG